MVKTMDFTKRLPLFARVLSFLSLLSVFLAYFLTITLLEFLTPAYKGSAGILALNNFIGTALGAVLCSVFLPSPKRSKSLLLSVGFIVLVILTQFIIKSFGVEIWLGVLSATVISTICSGMLCPLSYGLFFLNFNFNGSKKSLSLPLFSIALTIGILTRYISVPLLEAAGLTADPIKTMNFLLAVIRWLALWAGVFSIGCVILMRNEKLGIRNEESKKAVTDWRKVWRLIGISVVFYIINAAVEMRLLPLFHYAGEPFKVSIIAVAVALIIFGFLANVSIERFLRWFLPIAIFLFILTPCLLLFNDNTYFIMLLSTLLAIFRYSSWAIFTVAIIECYVGGWWFYSFASVIYFTNIFSYVGPLINRVLPRGTEFTVLFLLITVAVFVFLVSRVLFSKTQKIETGGNQVSIPAITDIFKENKLSERETEIANLIVNEGLNNEEIAKKLFLAPYYRKAVCLANIPKV